MNLCVFIGRLTREPEIRVTQNGKSVARFSIAVDKRYKQEGKPQANFFNVEAWNGTAEFVEKYFHKGMRIAVKGEMDNEDYTDKDGVKRKAYTLKADTVEFADGKQDATPQGTADGFSGVDSNDQPPFA